MPSIDEVYGSGELLKAADLQGQEPTVTIATVEAKEFNDGGKLIISFVGKTKKLVCNKTNANRIAFMFGKDYTKWGGKSIVLYTDLVDFQGRTVEAIRVRPPKHPRDNGPARVSPKEPPPDMTDDELNEAVPF